MDERVWSGAFRVHHTRIYQPCRAKHNTNMSIEIPRGSVEVRRSVGKSRNIGGELVEWSEGRYARYERTVEVLPGRSMYEVTVGWHGESSGWERSITVCESHIGSKSGGCEWIYELSPAEIENDCYQPEQYRALVTELCREVSEEKRTLETASRIGAAIPRRGRGEH